MKISVVLPVYNSQSTIGYAIESALRQRGVDIELLCVDDGSVDASWQVIENYMLRDSRVVGISQKNQGAGSARNHGLDLATGQYVSFLDADDQYASEISLVTLLRQAQETGTALSIGRKLHRSHFFTVDKGLNNLIPNRIYRAEELPNAFLYQCCLFERDLIEDNHLRFPGYLRFQDPPFLIEAAMVSKRFSVIDNYVYYYRRTGQRVKWNARKLEDYVAGVRSSYMMAKEATMPRVLHQLPRCLDDPSFLMGVLSVGDSRIASRVTEFHQRVMQPGSDEWSPMLSSLLDNSTSGRFLRNQLRLLSYRMKSTIKSVI